MSVHSDTGPFTIIPEWLLDSDVSDKAIRLYALFGRYADNKDGQCYPSRKALAKRMRCHPGSLERPRNELIEAGALLAEQRWLEPKNGAKPEQTTTLYTLLRTPPRALTRPPAQEHASELEPSELEPLNLKDLAPTARKPDLTWDAVMAVCGVTQVTSSARGAYNRAVADLKSVDATPTDIGQHAQVFRTRWPDVSLTPTALARRWGETDPQRQHSPIAKGSGVVERALARAEGLK